jgi:hypothetical protein
MQKNALNKNIKVVSSSIDKINMIYKMELENNTMINMQREIMFNFSEIEKQDVIEIDTMDNDYTVSFIINRSKEKSNIFVVSMKDHESDKVLKIEPHSFYSLAKVTGNKRNTYNKTMLNTNIKEKYMKLIDSFVKYLQKKDNVNLENGYAVIYEEIESLVYEITKAYELKANSKKRIK